MGENKAIVSLMGRSLLSWAVGSLSDLVNELVVVTKNAEEAEFYKKEVSSNVRILHDIVPNEGPLVGIYSAFKVMESEYCYVHPVDSPIINAKVVELLFQKALGYDGAVIKLGKDLIEPLHAVYKRDSALRVAERALRLGDSSVKILAKETRVRYVTLDDLRVYDKELVSLLNINTKNDLKMIENYLRRND
jgi:molybdenum cofactor guanylyltransferase